MRRPELRVSVFVAGARWHAASGARGQVVPRAQPGRRYTNPSSPYGILVLPLAPTESVAAKLAPDSDVPDFVRKVRLLACRLHGRNVRKEYACPTLLRLTSSGAVRVGLTAPLTCTAAQDMADRSKSSTVPPASRGPSAAWQLGPSEAVVLAGCLPPARASRYFAFTNNLHSLYDEGVSQPPSPPAPALW